MSARLFYFTSQFINSQKKLFAIPNSVLRNKRMEDESAPSLIFVNIPDTHVGTMIYRLENFIGRVSDIYEDTDGNKYVQFVYWYDNDFTRLLRSELIIAEEMNKFILPGENRKTVSLHEEDIYYKYEFIIEKINISNTLCTRLSREKYELYEKSASDYEASQGRDYKYSRYVATMTN